MDQKTISWVSYLTPLGWLIAFVGFQRSNKSSLGAFHLRQSLGVMITTTIIYFLFMQLTAAISLVFFVIPMMWVVLVIFWLLGFLAAINAEEKPATRLSGFYQNLFRFIR